MWNPMKTKIYALITIALLLLGSCARINKVIPNRVKDAACPLLEASAVRAARDVERFDIPQLPDLDDADAIEAEDILRRWAADHGISINVKPTIGWDLWDDFAHMGSTPPELGIWLPFDIDDRTPSQRSALIWHEAGHEIAHRRLGTKSSTLQYVLLTGFRVGSEWPLFVGQWDLRARWENRSEMWKRTQAGRRVKLLWRKYFTQPFTTKQCLREVTGKL